MPRNPNKTDYSSNFPSGFETFQIMDDPRNGGHTLHHFGEIIFMAFTCILCGVKSYDLMEEFGNLHEDWLRKWLKLPSGVPSYNTFSRVFQAIHPEAFASWLGEFLPEIPLGGSTSWLPVGLVTDRADGKLAHLDGLNLSRAWMLEGIAHSLPEGDKRRLSLINTANAHREDALVNVSGEHYAGGHWLASFATYLETSRGLVTSRSSAAPTHSSDR